MINKQYFVIVIVIIIISSHVSENFTGLTERGTSKEAPVVNYPPANTGDIRGTGSIPGLGKSPEGGHGNPLEYSCLENPMDRETWQATI